MKDLFGQEVLPSSQDRVHGKRKAEIMHRQLISAYGLKPGVTCKNCIFLKRFERGRKTWSKCAKATVEGHLATDWRVAWQACGNYEKDNPNLNTQFKSSTNE